VSNGLEITGSFKVFLRPLAEDTVTSRVTVSYDGFTVTFTGDHMAYTLPVDQKVDVQVAYVDAKGNPAAVDGNPTWSSSDPSLLDVVADAANAFIAHVVPVGPAGNAQVKVEADADLGAGTKSLVTLMDVTMVAGEAVAGTITPAGAPVPQAAPQQAARGKK